MAPLSTYLTTPERRPAVIADACDLAAAEVGRARGVSGLAIRSAWRVLTSVRPGIVHTAVDELLDPFAAQLDPFYQEHVRSGEPLEDVLDTQRGEMADALLSIADARVARSGNAAVKRAYRAARGSARGYVQAAAPGIAGLISAHTPPVEER